MIKFLQNTEKVNTRKIWEKIFTEDSEKFLDYYYSEKTKYNEIIVKLIDNQIVSMLHLNPYDIFMNDKIFKSYYIVAVATLETHRKKGYMNELLTHSIKFMNNKKIPFAFLRPAKEEIYLPYDFRYIYNHNYLEIKDNINLQEVPLNNEKYEFLADFINSYLKKYFNVFSKRTSDYIKTLHKEVKSENGDIILLYENSKFLGCYIYWGIKEKITRAIFNDSVKIEKNKPLVMARIINLNTFFENITSNKQNLKLTINLIDDIILENNGLFEIIITEKKSTIKKITELSNTPVLNINIANLTSLFFKYKNITEFTNNKEIIGLFKNINMYNAFFDEEV